MSVVRVTSALWVGAYVRRVHGDGAIAIVARKGAEEAGAIFVVVDRLDGNLDLYGPAPQSEFDEARPTDRLFQRLLSAASREAVNDRLERELRFDPDVWVVDVEDRTGEARLDLV